MVEHKGYFVAEHLHEYEVADTAGQNKIFGTLLSRYRRSVEQGASC